MLDAVVARSFRRKETSMPRCRLAPLLVPFLAIAAVMICFGSPQHALAQRPATPPSIDPVGPELNLTPKTIVYVAWSGTWDKVYDTLIDAFKKLNAYLDGA